MVGGTGKKSPKLVRPEVSLARVTAELLTQVMPEVSLGKAVKQMQRPMQMPFLRRECPGEDSDLGVEANREEIRSKGLRKATGDTYCVETHKWSAHSKARRGVRHRAAMERVSVLHRKRRPGAERRCRPCRRRWTGIQC